MRGCGKCRDRGLRVLEEAVEDLVLYDFIVGDKGENTAEKCSMRAWKSKISWSSMKQAEQRVWVTHK